MTQEIVDLLEQYGNTFAMTDCFQLDRDEAITNLLIDAGLWPAFDDINLKFEQKIEEATKTQAELKKQIHALMLEHGETVQSQHMTAKWCKPRISWNDAGLVGFAMAYPELLAFRREGEPSVAIVQRKGS